MFSLIFFNESFAKFCIVTAPPGGSGDLRTPLCTHNASQLQQCELTCIQTIRNQMKSAETKKKKCWNRPESL